MPMAIDQPDNANRLVGLGVAERLKPHAFRAKAIAEKLDQLITSRAVTKACQDVAKRFNGIDPLSDTCRVIEDFATSVL